ncbi:MAG: hypothetical protein J4F48_11045 [Nitrospinae bacterium]|nr:hypothetical protein [Nitrospinota bacterium]
MRKIACYIITFALVLYGYGAPVGFTAETKKISCIKLETLIEANEQDFAAFRKRNKIDIDQEGITAGEVADLTMMAAVMAFLSTVGSGFVVMSARHPAMREEFKRLKAKSRELRNRASRENCNMPPSTAPWKVVDEIFNPPFEQDPVDDVSP